MKTTKKGFTLIELIVVIAIIGVLAAILVPSMLGYVKKSKVSSANSAASSIQKAINTALIEMDEEDETGADVENIFRAASGNTITVNPNTVNAGKLWTKIKHYMDKAKNCAFSRSSGGWLCWTRIIRRRGTMPGGVSKRSGKRKTARISD